MPTAAELLAAMPAEDVDVQPPNSEELERIFQALAERPIPTGTLGRMGTLSGLSAKLALAYVAYWIRSWYLPEDQRKRDLLDTNLRSALRTLEAMGYMRGAVAKLGQLLPSFPELVPAEFVDTLSNLQFQAPPMHFSLIREQLLCELGDPEDIFAEFDETAFAAASIGQVHRGRLKSGEEVAVKIQYPGIARTIRSDLRSLKTMMRPFHYNEDWKAVKGLFGELRTGLEAETNYEQEAQNLREVRQMFVDDESIAVPRVIGQYSTNRVLTMEFIEGQTLDAFLESNPSQDQRDHFGTSISRALYRVQGKRMLYSDAHPGNFLFADDGRLGFIDFGNVRRFTEKEWEFHNAVFETRLSKDKAAVRELCADSALMTKAERVKHADVVDVIVEWLDHYCEPFLHQGKFDYGDPDFIRRGSELLVKAAKMNWVRQKPQNVFAHRLNFQLPALLYRLKSQVDVQELLREEGELR